MSRELWLLRHGKAERNIGIDDFDRSLNKRGKGAARRIGNALREQRLAPDWVVSSPAKRAWATAKIVHEALAAAGVSIVRDKRLYQEGFERLKTVLADCPADARRVLLVGHNPDLEDLLIHLAGAANLPDVDKLIPTAALVRLVMPDDWSRLDAGCARLLSITRPKSLPDEAVE